MTEFGWTEVIVWTVALIAVALYGIAARMSARRFSTWPLRRTMLWSTGVACIAFSVAGPIAARAHTDFTMHMFAHLLLGMAAPLCIAMSAPVTLLMRTVPVRFARKISKVLRSAPVSFIGHPAIASVLNIGGLWVLYGTSLYTLMHHSTAVHVLVHFHMFMAAYVFTISFIYIDPVPHRRSFPLRATVLVIALAGHAILAKLLYAHPPAGVPLSQAKSGAMFMFYGGDLIDAVLIYVFCMQWYRQTVKSSRAFLPFLRNS